MAKIKHKKIVKELKQPDQFVDFWSHTWQRVVDFMGPRQKPAIAGAVALAVVLVGASIINYWDGSRRDEASGKLTRIQEIANAELAGDTADAKDAPRAKTTSPASRPRTSGRRPW